MTARDASAPRAPLEPHSEGGTAVDAAIDIEAIPAEERILRAATAALTRLDPAALTIKRICRAAAVTPPTLYYHFGNKDGLVAAAVERLVADWLAMMDTAVGRGNSLSGTLHQAMAAWEVAIVAPSRPLSVFAWATLLLADSSELARTALVSARDRGRAMIVEVVSLHVPAGPAVEMIAGTLLDGVIASAVQYELDHDRAALRQRLDGLAAAVRLLVAHASDDAGAVTGG